MNVFRKIVSHKTSKSDRNCLLRFSQNVDKQTYTHILQCEGKHSLWFKKCALLKQISATQPYRLPAQNTFRQSQTPKSVVNNFSLVDRILGQDVCHVIKPPAIFKPAIKIPTAIIMLVGWDFSGLPALSNTFGFNTFECNVENIAFVNQVKKWYKLESYGKFKQADPFSAADIPDQNVLF